MVVAPAVLCDGIVLTHRLTPDECDTDTLDLGADLAAFAYRSGVLHDGVGDEWEPCDEDGPPHWHSPPAALGGFGPGALVGVRVQGGEVEIGAIDAFPVADAELADRLGVVYDREVADTGLPVDAADLVRGLLVDVPDAFDHPRPPLTDLCRAAGFDVGPWVADDPELWRNQRHVAHVHACIDELDGRERDDALAVVAAAHDPDDGTLAAALRILADPSLLTFLADELIGDGDPDLVDDAAAFADRLLAAARKPRQVAVARWWAAPSARRYPIGCAGSSARHTPSSSGGVATWRRPSSPCWVASRLRRERRRGASRSTGARGPRVRTGAPGVGTGARLRRALSGTRCRSSRRAAQRCSVFGVEYRRKSATRSKPRLS